MRICKCRYTLQLLLFCLLILSTSCEKPEGYGGTASIKGTLVKRFYNDDYSLLLRERAAVDEEVSLVFGDNTTIGDQVETSADGSFQFNYLFPGTYTLFYLSEDSLNGLDDEIPTKITFELTQGMVMNLDTLYTCQTLDFDDGAASISGVIRLINYKNSSEYPFLVVKDTSYAQEHEVYLVYGSHQYYDERIRTGYDGYFEFPNLIKGDYTIYTYSEDLSGATEDIPLIFNLSITGEEENKDLGTIFVQQL